MWMCVCEGRGGGGGGHTILYAPWSSSERMHLCHSYKPLQLLVGRF